MNRRQAIGALASLGIALRPAHSQAGGMIYRTLGKTGEKVSAIGLGGAHIGRAASPELATTVVRAAIDRGITFMDNCWDYVNGEAERRMGNALRDGYRQKVFRSEEHTSELQSHSFISYPV